MIELTDFPKLHCPFVRRTYEVDKDDWRKHGRELQLRKSEVYLVTPEINPGYEWVFDDPDTIAVEKLDGTNVKLLTENGRLISLYNRKNPIDPLNLFISKGRTAIIEGVFRAVAKEYLISRFAAKMGNKIMAEGLVFYNLKRKEQKLTNSYNVRNSVMPAKAGIQN